MIYTGICDRMPLTSKLPINMEVSGGSNCNRNANSGTKIDVAKSHRTMVKNAK